VQADVRRTEKPKTKNPELNRTTSTTKANLYKRKGTQGWKKKQTMSLKETPYTKVKKGDETTAKHNPTET
jgi:hypothetical protein